MTLARLFLSQTSSALFFEQFEPRRQAFRKAFYSRCLRYIQWQRDLPVLHLSFLVSPLVRLLVAPVAIHDPSLSPQGTAGWMVYFTVLS